MAGAGYCQEPALHVRGGQVASYCQRLVSLVQWNS
jgi:hypothetical protein